MDVWMKMLVAFHLRKGERMASIQVKGINDYLLFICNDEVDEAVCLQDLEQFLRSPSLQKDHFYVKGFFDLGHRVLTEELFSKLFTMLQNTGHVLFCGLYPFKQTDRHLAHMRGIIRNGEIYDSREDLLFEGRINPGGRLRVQGKVYLLGSCQGMIEVHGIDACVNASCLDHASLYINDKQLQDVSTDVLTSFYDDGQTIKCMTEVEKKWQEQS